MKRKLMLTTVFLVNMYNTVFADVITDTNKGLPRHHISDYDMKRYALYGDLVTIFARVAMLGLAVLLITCILKVIFSIIAEKKDKFKTPNKVFSILMIIEVVVIVISFIGARYFYFKE